MKPKELNTPHHPTWCPGCGDFAIWIALKNALVKLGLDPANVVISYGIGCSGNENNFIQTYAFHSLHGRPLPPAIGIKIANDKLTVIAVSGDGDAYGEGGNHFIHACRGNHDLTYIVHNNEMYSLTTGQASPTSEKGMPSKSTPQGIIELPLNPLALALSSGASFIARGFSGRADHLTDLLVQAIKHRGFSFVDVLQPCVTFNKLNTFRYFYQRVYQLQKEGYQPNDKQKAFKKAIEWGKRIPIGVFYQETRPTYQEELAQIKEKPLVEHSLKGIDITENMKELV